MWQIDGVFLSCLNNYSLWKLAKQEPLEVTTRYCWHFIVNVYWFSTFCILEEKFLLKDGYPLIHHCIVIQKRVGDAQEYILISYKAAVTEPQSSLTSAPMGLRLEVHITSSNTCFQKSVFADFRIMWWWGGGVLVGANALLTLAGGELFLWPWQLWEPY